MIDKIAVILLVAFVGLPMLPYLLWGAWENRIAFKKKARGLDFNPSASKSEGQL